MQCRLQTRYHVSNRRLTARQHDGERIVPEYSPEDSARIEANRCRYRSGHCYGYIFGQASLVWTHVWTPTAPSGAVLAKHQRYSDGVKSLSPCRVRASTRGCTPRRQRLARPRRTRLAGRNPFQQEPSSSATVG